MKCSTCDKIKQNNFIPKKDIGCKRCISDVMHKYYLRNKENIKERSRLWKKNNKEKVIQESKRYRMELKINALKAYSNNKVECACCGEKEIDFLCLDHIDNNGAQERRQKKYALGNFFKWLKKNNYSKNVRLQVLCFNCNMSKKIRGGICIHKLKK